MMVLDVLYVSFSSSWCIGGVEQDGHDGDDDINGWVGVIYDVLLFADK
jgi:hypothetical protein